MNDEILNAIDEEIARLRQARALLADLAKGTATKPSAAASDGSGPRRKLSAKARQAIADAQRRRWAKVRGEKKPAATTAPAEKQTAAG